MAQCDLPNFGASNHDAGRLSNFVLSLLFVFPRPLPCGNVASALRSQVDPHTYE